MDWARVLAYITGTVDQELLLRNEYLAAKNRIRTSGGWWMKQIARNVTMDGWGVLNNCRYLIHDRDTKYCQSFRDIIESCDVKTLPLPARSPNLNATYCYFQPPRKQRLVLTDQSVVRNA